MRASYRKHILDFKRPSGTSRGILTTKETWYIILEDKGKTGIGECGLLRGLSIDDLPDYEATLKWVCNHITSDLETLWKGLKQYPSIQFGLEQALLSLSSQNPFELFPSDFTRGAKGIPINGLIWMGDKGFMKSQIQQKIQQGFRCIKMKIGAIDFETEIKLLTAIRAEFTAEDIELRVDANGAFNAQDAMKKLQRLAELDIHSIEQPIGQGQWEAMADLCKNTPIPIALDEELIGQFEMEQKHALLHTIKPQYLILKPSLIGGFKATQQWIDLCEKASIGWWLTSALESNIGLNAIAQWAYTLNNQLPQGLGTGSLYTNNIESPLRVKGDCLYYTTETGWEITSLKLK